MHQSSATGARKAIRRVRRLPSRAVVTRARVQRHLDRSTDAIAMTFDDGPDPEHTPRILDALAELGVVATFFLVGHRAREHPQIVRRTIEEGHAVGSHSDSHPEPWGLSLHRLIRDYARGRAEVEWAAQRAVPLFRPPKGYIDARGAAAMLVAGLRPWLWTIDPHDWEPNISPSEILTGLADLRGGDVLLLHDAIEGPLAPAALDRSATCAVLPGIVALAHEQGLRFTTLA